MIRINLLPPELRRAARTPRALFLTLVGGVAATMLVGFSVLGLWLSVKNLRDQVERHQIDVNIAQEKAREVDRINEDIAFYKEREKAIIEIKSQRVLWAPKLEQLISLTPSNVWVTRIEMQTLDRSEYKWDDPDQTGGHLNLTCYAEGTDVTSLTNYRRALQGDQLFYKDLIDVRALPDHFFGDFLRMKDPSWTQVNLEGYAQPESLQFTVELDLRPRFQKPVMPGKGKNKKRKG